MSHYFSDMAGYVSFVSPQRVSGKNNPYFDVKINVAENECKQIRVMANSNTKRSLFLEKQESRGPVAISGLSPSKSGLIFFNSNSGTRLVDSSALGFKYTELSTMTISSLTTASINQTYDFKAQICWVQKSRRVACGENKDIMNDVRDAVIADGTGNIQLSVWGSELIAEIADKTTYLFTNIVLQNNFGRKMATTGATTVTAVEKIKIDWDCVDSVKCDETVCCPDVLSVKLSTFLTCVNIDCKRKVMPYAGETTVTCTNPVCRRKMLLKRCRKSYNCELTFEKNDRQFTITLFPKVIENFFGECNIELLEEKLLLLENFDITFTKRRIAVLMCDHVAANDVDATKDDANASVSD